MAQVGDGFRRALGGDYELLPAIGRLPDVIRPSSRQMSLKRSTFVPNVTATALAAIALGVRPIHHGRKIHVRLRP